MASSNFIPDREAELANWSRAFDEKITADPASYGLSIAQAADYNTLHVAFVNLLALTTSRTGNTSSNVLAKNEAKTALVSEARKLARIIRANPSVNDTQRRNLGLTLPVDPVAKVNQPSEPPRVLITDVYGRDITIRLVDVQRKTRRARPDGVLGASVFIHIGEEPPEHSSGWSFYGQTTRTKMMLRLGSAIGPGQRLWITACWVNPRLVPGPMSTPIDTYTDHRGVLLPGQMRMAA